MFERDNQLRCPKCKRYHINVQAVFDVKEEKERKGCIYWMLFGWFEMIALPIRLLFGEKKKYKAKTRSYAVCQDCGYRWEVKQ